MVTFWSNWHDMCIVLKTTIWSSKVTWSVPLKFFSFPWNISLYFFVVDSKKVKNLTSVAEAKSVLKCIEILQDEKLFTQKDVIYMQFLCQEADCFDLFSKCIEYAEKQEALCYFEKPLGKVYASWWLCRINNIILLS